MVGKTTMAWSTSRRRSHLAIKLNTLLYLAMGTRPDIAYAVSLESRNLDNPTHRDWLGNSTVNIKVLLCTIIEMTEAKCCLVMQTTTAVQETLWLRTRLFTFYGAGAITWRSKLQEATSNSTTEAEYGSSCFHKICDMFKDELISLLCVIMFCASGITSALYCIEFLCEYSNVLVFFFLVHFYFFT